MAYRTQEQVLKDSEAAALRRAGLTFAEIAQSLSVPTTTAFNMVQRAYADLPAQKTEDARNREILKLDVIEERAYDILNRFHYTVSAGGKVVTMDGVPVEDDTVALKAAETLLKVAQRRAKLLGLDAPTQVNVEVTHDANAVDAELAAIRAALAGPGDTPLLVDESSRAG